MTKYIVKRILLIVPVVLAVIFLVYGILYITPGSSLNRMEIYAGDGCDSFFSMISAAPGFFTRYIRYCYNVFVHLDFGASGRHAISIADQVFMRWKWTLKLAGLSLLVSAAVGIPSGIASAVNPGGRADRFISAVATVFSSVPSYCLAVGLALLFALKLGWFPTYGVANPGSLVLPVVTVSASGISQFIRVVRAAVSETLDKNYITALRAAGHKERVVVGVHALRNALVPITASLGETATKILGGTFVAEKFFAVPGVGFYLIKAIGKVEYEIILACAASTAVFLVILNIVTDIICLMADPQLRKRITSGGGKRGSSGAK